MKHENVTTTQFGTLMGTDIFNSHLYGGTDNRTFKVNKLHFNVDEQQFDGLIVYIRSG